MESWKETRKRTRRERGEETDDTKSGRRHKEIRKRKRKARTARSPTLGVLTAAAALSGHLGGSGKDQPENKWADNGASCFSQLSRVLCN